MNGMPAPIAMTIGWIAHGTKTTRMQGYCHCCHWGAILTRGCALMEPAYQHWKTTVDDLWEDECARQQAAACQCLLNEHAAHNHQDAADLVSSCVGQYSTVQDQKLFL